MPRRKRRAMAAEDIIDDVVDSAVDAVTDRAAGFFSKLRNGQMDSFEGSYLKQSFSCATCRKSFPNAAAMEMVHPSNGFGLCRSCFSAAYNALKEKVERLGAQARARPRAAPPRQEERRQQKAPPRRAPVWEVLGVSRDASAADVKRAYRQKALELHPDRTPVSASADEQLRAKAAWQELQQAYNVMMSVRSAPGM